MDPLFTAVDRYIDALFIPEDPILDAAVRATEAAGMPSIQVSPGQGKLLYLLARMAGARRILELGTLGGYSTIWLARALPADGHLISLEYSAVHADVARANLDRAGLRQRVDVQVGPALESLARLAAGDPPPFDLVFIDADKPNYTRYLAATVPLTRPGGLIVADNVVRRGLVLEQDSPDPAVQGVREFNEALAAEPRVEAIIVQQVGDKGHDGLAIARVKE